MAKKRKKKPEEPCFFSHQKSSSYHSVFCTHALMSAVSATLGQPFRSSRAPPLIITARCHFSPLTTYLCSKDGVYTYIGGTT